MNKTIFPKAGKETYLIVMHDNKGEYVADSAIGFKAACNKLREYKKMVKTEVCLAQVLVSYNQEI